MKSRKSGGRRESAKSRRSIPEYLLEAELKAACEALEVSCGWAINLSEAISDFDSSFSNALADLKKLIGQLSERQFEVTERLKIRKALQQIRSYSRKMASDEEPLSIAGIMEDVRQIVEIANLV